MSPKGVALVPNQKGRKEVYKAGGGGMHIHNLIKRLNYGDGIAHSDHTNASFSS